MNTEGPRAALERIALASGESLAGLSRMLGRNPAYLQQFVRRGSPRLLAEADRALLAAYLRVDEAVLGGPTRRTAPPTVCVRRLEEYASAGPGALSDDDRVTGGESFDPRLLAALNVRAGSCAMLHARGDSMAPTIEDGDWMLVDEADRCVTRRSRIFVCRMDGALLVKRLSLEGRGVRVMSDNPRYSPLLVEPATSLDVIGRVVWLSRALG